MDFVVGSDLDVDHDGEVVGGGARYVALQLNLLGCVGGGNGFGLLRRAVGVGQDTVFGHFYVRGHEDVVDAAFGEVVGGVVVKRAVGRVTECCRFVGVGKRAAVGDREVRVVGLVNVEVARDECLTSGSDLPDFLLHEFRTLHACLRADVIHVEVEEDKLLAGGLVDELTP